MNKEKLKKLSEEIDKSLDETGMKPDQVRELKRKLLKYKEEQHRKMVAAEVVKALMNPVDGKEIVKAIEGIKITPNIKVRPPMVNVEQEPKVIVRDIPPPKVNVEPPKVNVEGHTVNVPDEFKIKGFEGFVGKMVGALKDKLNVGMADNNRKNPLYVILVDDKGKIYKAEGQDGVLGFGGPSRVYLRNKDNETADPLESVGSPYVYNLTMTTSGSPYSQVLPDNTRKLTVKLRDVGAQLQVAWESGGNYTTIPVGGTYNLENVKLVGKTLYLTADNSNQVAEITAWTKE